MPLTSVLTGSRDFATALRFGVTALHRPGAGSQPVAELRDQALVVPSAEERIDGCPGGEAGRNGPPLHTVVKEVADRVKHDAAAVALRLSTRPSSQAGTKSSGRIAAHSASVRPDG